MIDHRQALAPQLQALGLDAVDAALNLADTDRYWDALGELLAPQGHVGLIVEPAGALQGEEVVAATDKIGRASCRERV